jgi:dolichol-phosphate mannosyltransferase
VTPRRCLSVVVPCYNERATVAAVIERVLASPWTAEVILVDDGSTDGTGEVVDGLCDERLQVIHHDHNQGKGAALRNGFAAATAEYVIVQDADLEYDPAEYDVMLEPLEGGVADVVFGSRFLSGRPHRVLYFWHSVGNRLLTLLSNMLTDLNLSDMETCYKVFKREVIQSLDLKEDRFGFEPEVVAKIAHQGLRIYEMGISYRGRTYAEGKKIGLKDAWRALYCILHYNLPLASVGIQLAFYTLAGGIAAAVNLVVFLTLFHSGAGTTTSVLAAYFLAAAVNYALSIAFIFRHRVRYSAVLEALVFLATIAVIGWFDLLLTRWALAANWWPSTAKLFASAIILLLNFGVRRYIVFPQQVSADWKPQNPGSAAR